MDEFQPPVPSGREGGPPRYVPTLTEVIQPVAEWVASPVAEPVLPRSEPEPVPGPTPPDDEEQLLRVLQRVEVLLDRRLSAAMAQAAESVSREFALRLRAEMEPLIRAAVSEAMAEEWHLRNRPPG